MPRLQSRFSLKIRMPKNPCMLLVNAFRDSLNRVVCEQGHCLSCGREQRHQYLWCPWHQCHGVLGSVSPPSSPGPARTPEQRPWSLMCCLVPAASPGEEAGALCKGVHPSLPVLQPLGLCSGLSLWKFGWSEPGPSLPWLWEMLSLFALSGLKRSADPKCPLGSLGTGGNSSCLLVVLNTEPDSL